MSRRPFYSEYEMRCWSRDELDASLAAAGFVNVSYFGAYDASIGLGESDRIVAVGKREP